MNETTSKQQAVETLREYGERDIIPLEDAREIIDPFGIELNVKTNPRVRKLKNLAGIYHGDGDTLAIGVSDLVVMVTNAVGLDAEEPTYGGHGTTAAARYNANLPKLEAHFGIGAEEVEK